jgi:hypothetical protein
MGGGWGLFFSVGGRSDRMCQVLCKWLEPSVAKAVSTVLYKRRLG